MIYRLPPILRGVRLDHPGIDLVVNNTPTATSVENILQNRTDLALVNLPVEDKQLKITPLCVESMVAIFPAGTRDVPGEITPDHVARQPLLVEQPSSAAYPLVLGWLSGQASSRPPMPLGTIEALKSAVASGLGMAIVPEVAVAMHMSDFIVRPLRPPLTRTLALIEHRNKPNEPALDIVRNALLGLRAVEAVAPKARVRTRKPRGGKSGIGALRVDLPDGQITQNPVKPARKKYSAFQKSTNQLYIFASSHPTRGADRDRHERAAGCGGREAVRRDERKRCGRRSRVVLTPRRWRQVCGKQNFSADDGGKKARSPGRARISRNTIAQGKPDASGVTCGATRALFTRARETAGAIGRPAFPAPSFSGRVRTDCKPRAHRAARTRGRVVSKSTRRHRPA